MIDLFQSIPGELVGSHFASDNDMSKRKMLQRLLSGSKDIRLDGARKMKDYHVNVFYSEEDNGYIADIPDPQHCSAFGETPEEALREVLEAKKAWIEAAREAGRSVPDPKYRPLIYQIG